MLICFKDAPTLGAVASGKAFWFKSKLLNSFTQGPGSWTQTEFFASSVFVKIRFSVRALLVEIKLVLIQSVLQEQLKALEVSRGF